MSLTKQTTTLKKTINKKPVTSIKMTKNNDTKMRKTTILKHAKSEFARLKADTMATGVEHHFMTVLPFESEQADGSIKIQYRSSQNFSTLNDDVDDIDLYDPGDGDHGIESAVTNGSQNHSSAQFVSY